MDYIPNLNKSPNTDRPSLRFEGSSPRPVIDGLISPVDYPFPGPLVNPVEYSNLKNYSYRINESISNNDVHYRKCHKFERKRNYSICAKMSIVQESKKRTKHVAIRDALRVN